MGTPHPSEVHRPPYGRLITLGLCLILLGLAVAWLYYPMRAVLDVGGACAEGGPYEIRTHCPAGSTLFLTLGAPLWFVGAFVGLFAAATISAPAPIMPGWALLFGALGWNFFDYAFHGDPGGRVVASWLVCGIVFWLMALPALVIFLGATIGFKVTDPPGAALRWIFGYLALLALGWWLGLVLMRAWS